MSLVTSGYGLGTSSGAATRGVGIEPDGEGFGGLGVAITRDRIGNATPFARQQGLTSVISVPQGLISDTNQPQLRAVSALNGSDIQLHYVQQGPAFEDGSWRQIRAQYAADLPAGVSGARGYPHFSETEILIEAGVSSPLPVHAQHPAIDFTKLRIEFETQMQGIAHQDAPIPYEFGAPGPVRTWRIDPLASAWRELRSPWTPQAREREELPDTVGEGGRYLRAYRVTTRLLPEGEDGSGGGPQDVTEPSLWAELLYEVASDKLDGWGRATRFWLGVGHSFTAPTADMRAPDFPMARFVSPPKCRIYSTDTVNNPIDVVIYGDKAFLPEQATQIAGGIEFGLTKWDQNVGTPSASEDLRGYDNLHDGMSRAYQGVIYWRGGAALTSSEQSTRSAILHALDVDAPGHDCVQYAISDNLKDYRTFGAYGIVHDPAEDGWDIETLRDEVSRKSREDYSTYVVDNARNPWQDCHLGTPAYTNQGGAQRGFGAITFMPWAMSGHPDMRPLWLCASQEAQRWHNFRKEDGSHWKWDELRTPGTPATYDSSAVFGDGRSWFSFNFNTSYPDLSAHEPWVLLVGRWGDVKRSNTRVGDFDISTPRGRDANGWKSYDFQHFVNNAWVAFTHLTGDRWCLDSQLVDQINLTICSRQTFPDPNRGTFAWSTEGLGVPRAEARWERSLIHTATLANRPEDQEVFRKRIAERSNWQRYIGSNTTPNAPNVFGDWDQDLFDELPELSRDNNGYFAQGSNDRYQLAPSGPAAWTTNPDAWAHWHVAKLTASIYGAYLLSQIDTNTVRKAQTDADTSFMLTPLSGKSTVNGWELDDQGRLLGFYAVPANDPGQVRGRAPLPSEWGSNDPTGYVLYDENGNLRTEPHFGPPIPGAGGIASFRRAGVNLATVWSGSTALIAHIFNPGDAAVIARQEELFVTNPIFPDAATRRAQLIDSTEPFQEFWAIIKDPFTWPKVQSGPVTYQESTEVSVLVEAVSGERAIVRESTTVEVPVVVSSAETVFDGVIQESTTANVVVEVVSAESAFGESTVQESTTAEVVIEVISGDREVVPEVTAAVVTVEVVSAETATQNVAGAAASTGTGQTVREAIGPTQQRARHARIIETSRGFKRMVRGRETGRGRGPRWGDDDRLRPDER